MSLKGGVVMNVLIACEESQRVCIAFRNKGHNAFSCDIQECSGGRAEWHIVGDVLKYLNGDCYFFTQNGDYHYIKGKWDLVIGFPPCTYISNAGACRLFKNHELQIDRFNKGVAAVKFFYEILNCNCDRVAVENPLPSKIFGLPAASQIIEPYFFGVPKKKRTLLWLRGLNPLLPTYLVIPEESTKVNGNWFNKGGKERQKNRSKTFKEVAVAMADQWG